MLQVLQTILLCARGKKMPGRVTAHGLYAGALSGGRSLALLQTEPSYGAPVLAGGLTRFASPTRLSDIPDEAPFDDRLILSKMSKRRSRSSSPGKLSRTRAKSKSLRNSRTRSKSHGRSRSKSRHTLTRLGGGRRSKSRSKSRSRARFSKNAARRSPSKTSLSSRDRTSAADLRQRTRNRTAW